MLASYGQLRTSVLLDLTNEQIRELVRVVFAHKNKNGRWNEFKDHELLQLFHERERGINFTKTDFLCSGGVEFEVRNFFSSRSRPPSDDSIAEFKEKISEWIQMCSKPHETNASTTTDSFSAVDVAEMIGSFIGYAIVLGPILYITIWIYDAWNDSGDGRTTSTQSNTQTERAALDYCIGEMTNNIENSCAEDPEFTYCSLNFSRSEILGSGCTSRIRAQGSYSEQVQFCKSESLSGVTRACAIEVYGEAAVTGRSSIR